MSWVQRESATQVLSERKMRQCWVCKATWKTQRPSHWNVKRCSGLCIEILYLSLLPSMLHMHINTLVIYTNYIKLQYVSLCYMWFSTYSKVHATSVSAYFLLLSSVAKKRFCSERRSLVALHPCGQQNSEHDQGNCQPRGFNWGPNSSHFCWPHFYQLSYGKSTN